VGRGGIRVAVVAGHRLIHGMARVACEGIGGVIVAEASTLSDARAVAGADGIDLLVLDVDLPDGDGLEVLRDLRPVALLDDARPSPNILVLSGRDDGSTVLDAMRLGAHGFLTKAGGLRDLAAAMRRVASGEQVVDRSLEASAVAEIKRYAERTRERAQIDAVLTNREREVLTHLSDGLTMQQIARRLGISPRTVETHVAKLYRKLGVRSRLQAVTRAAAIGLIDV
jgi:DNA-binding NarL/FixJ family response regulator